MEKKRLTVRELVLCALFATLIAVGTMIRIPTPLLPLTLQTFFVALSGLILGSKLGAVSVAVYAAAGFAGIPGFSVVSGFARVLTPTFGYILGFIPGAWLAGRVTERGTPGFWRCFWAAVAANAVIYAVGIPYYYIVAKYYVGNPLGARALLLTFVLMPMPGDLLKCLGAAALAQRLKRLLPNGGH